MPPERSGPTGPLDDERMVPHPARLDPRRPDYEKVLRAHRRAVAAGRSGYQDPSTGLFVLTARTLWDRGSCCDSGCRHCPWVERP